jgi:hypothetical protein
MDKIEIKKHILTAAYGKFDFIDQIVSKDILLIAPPRVIINYLIVELNIEKSDIKMPAFRSWLHYYRKNKQQNPQSTKNERNFTNTNETDTKKNATLTF